MNFNRLLHFCFKNFNCLTNCKHSLQGVWERKTSSFFIWWLWCLTTKSWPFCWRLQSSTHTQSCPGLICRDRCIDPDQIRCQSMKLSSFPLVVAVWEQKQPPTSLRTSALKGETHAWLNFRPDHKECDLGLGRQQSLSAQQWGFRREDPRHQIASGKTRFSQVTPFLLSFLSRFQTCTETLKFSTHYSEELYVRMQVSELVSLEIKWTKSSNVMLSREFTVGSLTQWICSAQHKKVWEIFTMFSGVSRVSFRKQGFICETHNF